MAANYNKLWKILIDRNIRKEDLRVAAGITTTAMAKLGKNQPVHMEILLKICKVLDCQLEDVVEITEDVIDKAKKIKDANDDIKKIDDILNDSTSFHHKIIIYEKQKVDGHIRHTIEIIYNFVEAIELPDFDSWDKFDY